MSNMAIQRWLDQTVSERGDVTSALVVLGTHDQPGHLTHWPADRPPDHLLLQVAQARLPGAKPAAAPSPAQGQFVTQSVRSHGKVVGALAMRLTDASTAPARNPPAVAPPAAPAVERAGPALPAPLAAQAPARAAGEDGDELMKLMRTSLAAQKFDRCAAALATELATAFACNRVFVGLSERRFVRVLGLSHGSQPGQEQALVRRVGAAMDEAVDQGATLLHPQHPDERPHISLAHAELAVPGAGLCILTVPMYHAGQPVGALTLERPQAARFDAATVRRIEAVGAALAPLLQLRAQHDRSAWQRLRAALDVDVATLGTGPRRALMLGAALATAALVALLLSRWTFHISAPTRLEGQTQRALVAPTDGFLKSAHVRAGDAVKEGQLLAELSDEDLRLERRRWETEVARFENTYAEAQAKQDRTQLVIADSRVAESRAQLALVDQQLARTRIVAPFDALVIKGDLNQQLGAPVKRGDLLLTLTPSREFRVMLEIDERDVAAVQPGTRGAVTLSALPDRRFELVIERVMPVAKAEAGRNLFEAEARMDAIAGADTDSLRPGLQGIARLDAGERPLHWLLSHRVFDWLRLQWWAWLG